jgi:hypothetical protein
LAVVVLVVAVALVGSASAAPPPVKNVRLAVGDGQLQLRGDWIAFTVRERAQGGRDLNGDGDLHDWVLHMYDAVSGKTVNVGLAAHFYFEFDGERVAFTVPEASQGGRDLNGDGDAGDSVLHVFDAARGQTVNVGLAAYVFLRLEAPRVAFMVAEAAQDGRDLNGDGDTDDIVLHVFDTASGEVVNVGLAPSPFDETFELEGGRVAFTVWERAQGERDLNGDGDADDSVLHVFEVANGETVNVGLAAYGFLHLEASRVACAVSEEEQGELDLNGDGDAEDQVLHVFDVASGKTVNVGLAAAGSSFGLEGGQVAITVDEVAQGERDLNGDGDARDDVLHLFDAATGGTVNVGLATHRFGLEAGRVAFRVGEAEQGGLDLNGDGDARDDVVHVFDAVRGATVNVGLAASFGVGPAGGRVAFAVDEAAQGGLDLNGDGDSNDGVLHLFNLANGQTLNVHLATDQIFVAEGRVAFLVPERGQGRRDLNRDGDRRDQVLHVYDPNRGTVNVRFAARFDFEFDGQRVAFLVPERGQGRRDLNRDGDRRDAVLHVYTLRPRQ